MTSEPQTPPGAVPDEPAVEMPRPTAWPLVVGLGLTLAAAGVVVSPAMLLVGALLLFVGVAGWVGQLLPGQGHVHEPLAEPERRPVPIQPRPGTVSLLQEGMPGYRMRLPEKFHPISAGAWGGLAGGLVMPVPALLWGALSRHGIWYPVNLLAGMLVPGVGTMKVPELEDFQAGLFVAALVIHVVFSGVVGLCYGVLLPTLPALPRPVAWGGLLMPLLWTAVSFVLMGVVNPVLARGVDWPWFIASQFLFGVVAALVASEGEKRIRPLVAGLLGGVAGGAVMPAPALFWGLMSGHGIWYPANLLAALVLPGLGGLPPEELEQFRLEWLVPAVLIHATMSALFGLAYGALLPRLRPIPAPVAWGGLVMPMLWTASSYGLMGVVNPVLQERVDWPWYIASQFVYGVAAAVVVMRSELIPVAPAGGPSRGPQP